SVDNVYRSPFPTRRSSGLAPTRQVQEHSYDAFLAKPRVQSLAPNQFTCPGCGARTESDAISKDCQFCGTALVAGSTGDEIAPERSEEHTSELQSRENLV